jgi:predicted nucleic acid binding AN1-type Zn finger protein
LNFFPLEIVAGMNDLEKPKRCQFPDCKQKLGLTAFACKCEKYFCVKHRLSEAHACSFNYFKEHQENLLKLMSSPVIGQKVETI